MIELLLVVLIAVISVSVYTYAYYILKFRDDTKHCPPCEPVSYTHLRAHET